MDYTSQSNILIQKAHGNCIINGEIIKLNKGQTISRSSPVDGRSLPEFVSANNYIVDAAVSSARQAYQQKRWTSLSLDRRKEILFKLSELILEHKLEIALLDCLSMGKAVSQLLQHDVPLAAKCIKWFAESLDKVYDHGIPPHNNVVGIISREPIGVVAGITPWNYPAENIAWKIGPALAAGNSLILKPAEQSTYSACFIGELAIQAGVPAGILNIIPGIGSETGKLLALHKNVDGVFFTGSTEIGKEILHYAADSNMKRVSLECGGKSPFIVLKSCLDLLSAAKSLAQCIFSNQGQTCSAPSRLIIDASIKEVFLSYLVSEAKLYKPQNPLDSETTVGAIVSHEQLERVLAYISGAKSEGARLILGGERVHVLHNGTYINPTVFDEVSSEMTIANEEIFGPVLSVHSFCELGEAIELANNSIYGLSAAIWSDDINHANKVAKELISGTVHINSYGEDDITAPFGGFKQSGSGSKEKSLFALDSYSQKKMIWTKIY